MKKNYHVAGRSNVDPKLISELVEVEADLAEKKRQLLLRQQEAEKLQEEVSTQPMKFYDQPVPTRGAHSSNKVEQHKPLAAEEDFFRKFDRNPNSEAEKRERWRKQLEEQMQQNRNQKASEAEEAKKRQMADDLMNELLAGRDKPKAPVVHSPLKAKVDDRQPPLHQPPQRQGSVQPAIRNRRNSIPEKAEFVNVFVRGTDEEEMAKIRQQKLKEHREFLAEQIRQEQLRKEEQKLFKKQKVDFSAEQAILAPPRKVVDPNGPGRKIEFAPGIPTLNQTDIEMREKQVRNKYRKGLISLEEFEMTLHRLQTVKPKTTSNVPNQPSKEERATTQEQHAVRQEPLDPYPEPPARQLRFPSRADPMPSSQLSAVSMHQPSHVFPTQAPQPVPQPSSVDVASIQAFQLEFMKRMFEEMKELMKTNRMMDQQILQEAVLKNMGMTLNTGMLPPQYQPPVTPQGRQQPAQPFQLPKISAPKQPLQQAQQETLHPSQISASQTILFEESLQADRYRLPYASSNAKADISIEQEEFYQKPVKIKAFKSFEYAEAMGASAIEIPGTSVFLTNPNAKLELKRRFDSDLVVYQKLAIRKDVEAAKNKQIKKQSSKQQLPEPYHPESKVKTEAPLVITPVERHAPEANPFRKPKPEQKSNSKVIAQKPEKKTSEVARMMNECLEQPVTADDLAEVRRELFKANNPLAIASKHNEILEKYEYSQSAIDNESLPVPSIVDQSSKVNPKESIKPPSSVVGRSNQWSVRQPPKLNPSAVEEETIQSVQYESIRRQSMSPAKECLQLSRRQLKNMQKLKENVLIDFIVREGERPNSLKKDDQEEEIEEQIQTRRDSKRQQEHEESATLVSNYEESVQKPIEKKSSSKGIPSPRAFATKSPPKQKPPQVERERPSEKTISERSISKESRESNITSLQEARKRAKQLRPKEKKDSIVNFEAIEQLQNNIKRKDPVSGTDILLLPPPVLEPKLLQIKANRKDSKELLSMLDNMAEDEDDHYTQDFHSYRSLSRPDGNRYKQRF